MFAFCVLFDGNAAWTVFLTKYSVRVWFRPKGMNPWFQGGMWQESMGMGIF